MSHLIDKAFTLMQKGFDQRENYASREQAEFMASQLRKTGKEVEIIPIWVHRGVRQRVTGGFHVYEVWWRGD